MRRFAFAIVPILFATAAIAATPTTGMSCQQARAIVASNGGVVLHTSTYEYDRYVSSRAFCAAGQITKPAWVPSRDVAQCYIGETCTDPDRFDHDTFR